MQQNEIERSRFSYTMNNERSASANRRRRTKSTVTTKEDLHVEVIPDPTDQPSVEPFKFNVPSVPPPPPPPPTSTTTTTTVNRKVVSPPPPPPPPPSSSSIPLQTPSIANASNKTEYAQSSNAVTNKPSHPLPTTVSSTSKYPSLTETVLAEHDRIHGTTPPYHTTKRDNLIKWTQDLALYDRLSPPFPEHEIPLESFHGASSSISSTTTTANDQLQSARGVVISQNNSNSNQSTSAATNNGGSIVGAGSTSTTVAGTSTNTTGGKTSSNTHSKSAAKTATAALPTPTPLLKQPTNTSTASTTVVPNNRAFSKASNIAPGKTHWNHLRLTRWPLF